MPMSPRLPEARRGLPARPPLRAVLLVAALLVGSGAARALELEGLMRTLGQVSAGEALFTERRQVLQLEQTLQSSGRLSFAAPDRFVRETLKPRAERMEVSGNTLTLRQGSRSHTLALDSNPEATAIVEAIRGTLTGNTALLQRHFDSRVSGSLERWTLELVPREARMRGQVAQVQVSGRQAALREVRILLADGDSSVMRIEPLPAPGR